MALLGIVVPYLVAWRISPAGTVFSGFLLNPVDGFSYLAKMRQGWGGSWLFQLPYTAEPGSGTLLFIFYIALGQISRLFGFPLLLTYHAARIIFSIVFFVVLYLFYLKVFRDDRLKWAGFLFSIFGSGLGWIALLALKRQSIDLWVPEAIPILTAYTNPHFPLAATAFIGGILLVYKKDARNWWHWVLAFVCGFTLGAVLPFATVTMFLVLSVWLIWESGVSRPWNSKGWFMKEPLTLGLLILGALPWLFYDYWLSLAHPVISQWNAQNLTPSPPLIDTFMGFGFMFLFALLSLWKKPWAMGRLGRLFTVWFVLGIVMLYMPLPFQRRLSMGLYLPMAGLTAWWLAEIFESQKSLRLAVVAIVASSLPSLLIVIAAGLMGVAQGNAAVVFSKDELDTYQWIDENVSPGSLFLTDPKRGNRLPAYADVRVLYGHPFETPDADFWEEEVQSLLDWNGDPERGLQLLSLRRVEWVLYHEASSALEKPTWFEALPIEFSAGVYKVLENEPK